MGIRGTAALDSPSYSGVYDLTAEFADFVGDILLVFKGGQGQLVAFELDAMVLAGSWTAPFRNCDMGASSAPGRQISPRAGDQIGRVTKRITLGRPGPAAPGRAAFAGRNLAGIWLESGPSTRCAPRIVAGLCAMVGPAGSFPPILHHLRQPCRKIWIPAAGPYQIWRKEGLGKAKS